MEGCTAPCQQEGEPGGNLGRPAQEQLGGASGGQFGRPAQRQQEEEAGGQLGGTTVGQQGGSSKLQDEEAVKGQSSVAVFPAPQPVGAARLWTAAACFTLASCTRSNGERACALALSTSAALFPVFSLIHFSVFYFLFFI